MENIPEDQRKSGKKSTRRIEKLYGKTIENIEIWTNKGWKIARKITKTEKKKGAKAWKNKELRAKNMVPEKIEHPVKRYGYVPEPDEKKCIELGKKIEKMIPAKTAGVHEKLIFREYPTGKATTEEERKCIHCGEFETIEHLMINCKVAKEIWKEHKEAGKEIIGREIWNRDVIIGDWEEELKGKEEEKQRKIGWTARRLIWASIRLTIMREIWNYRNNKKYEKRW